MKKSLATVRAWEKEHFVIFSSLIEEDVLAQARASDERHRQGKPLSILDGVPVAFKDMLNVKGHTIYNGCNPSKEFAFNHVFATSDDIHVDRFRDAGAIIFGVTIMSEGGMTSLGYNSHFQGPVNPYSWYRYPGGSSSGSAVAVATGIVPIALGYDGGGSARTPAAMSGVHGMATTYGRIPFTNSTSSTNAKSGPITASAVDNAIAMSVMLPNDLTNRFSLLYDGGIHGPPHAVLTGITDIEDLSDVRIGVYRDWINDNDPIVAKGVYDAVEWLQSRGATIVNISIPHLQMITFAHTVRLSSEFAQRWDKAYFRENDGLEPVSRTIIGLGQTVTDVEVIAAEKVRGWAFDYVTKLFEEERLTSIAVPTIGLEVPILSKDAKKIGESNTPLNVKVIKYSTIANLLGLPGYTVPIGFHTPSVLDPHESADTKVPLAIQFLGDHWSEHKVQ
jgi:Asp-tRNA(Asn)/Glu-tRNA(Gln) amidotransferase A subunit family amidase